MTVDEVVFYIVRIADGLCCSNGFKPIGQISQKGKSPHSGQYISISGLQKCIAHRKQP